MPRHEAHGVGALVRAERGEEGAVRGALIRGQVAVALVGGLVVAALRTRARLRRDVAGGLASSAISSTLALTSTMVVITD